MVTDFLIIGGEKCGTTINEYLIQHPNIEGVMSFSLTSLSLHFISYTNCLSIN